MWLILLLVLALLSALPFLIQAAGNGFAYSRHTTTSPPSAALSFDNVQSAGALEASFRMRGDTVRGGGEIRFADDSALQASNGISATTHQPQQSRRAGTASLYVVREADTLSGIAEMFSVSVNTIVWANDLSDRTIQPGDTLVILPMTGVRHTVEEGETLSSIAKTYEADIEEVRQFNDLDEDSTLAVGDNIDIPHGEKGATITHSRSGSETHSPAPAGSSIGGSWLIRPINGIKTQNTHGYNAIDFGAPVGTGVVASAGGSVIVAKAGGWNGGYGSYVIVEHPNGAQTLYAHLSSVLVGIGERVVQGEVIGYSGNSGRSTGPHLHFEVRGAVNPF